MALACLDQLRRVRESIDREVSRQSWHEINDLVLQFDDLFEKWKKSDLGKQAVKSGRGLEGIFRVGTMRYLGAPEKTSERLDHLNEVIVSAKKLKPEGARRKR